MKYLLVIVSLFFCLFGYSENSSSEIGPNWKMTKSNTPFAYTVEFLCRKGEIHDGKVIRTGLFCPRYYYDYFDRAGSFLARGITRAFSWGMFFAWGMELDVYDEHSDCIGKIEGQFFTKARAKFVFYDQRGHTSATAYLDSESAEFFIVSSFDESIILAELKGKDFGDFCSLDLNTLYPHHLDERVLKVFMAFVADYLNEFLPPSKVETYYIIVHD